MVFTYYLPDATGNKIEYGTSSNAVIIIGANGAGKSKLGAWMEMNNLSNIHRVGAQRNLNFKENIPLKSYSEAEDLVFFGSSDNSSSWKENKGHRWNYGNSYTTTLLNDFENVLAALIALTNIDNAKFIEECKLAEQANQPKPHTPITAIDKLVAIWNIVLPQREIKYFDGKFTAKQPNRSENVRYSSNQMSDGERAVLYLVAQVLCVPQNKTLIIDEPEIHLHRSIMNRLWMALEEARPDCLFIYITHDTQFAAMHSHADKIWIRDYDGTNWHLERVLSQSLPEELLLEILGSRKDVLFVEGNPNSYDSQLYSYLYPNYHVIPCGSCTQVISKTKIFRNTPSLHHCSVYGIIDRDYRSDYEIESYKSDGIFTLRVAEVENLFLVEELIRLIAVHMGLDADVVFSKVKEYVVDERYSNQIERQICQSVVAQLKYQLSTFDISKQSEAEAKSSLNQHLSTLNYDAIKATEETKFRKALTDNDYAEVLRVFNEKSIVNSVARFFNIVNREYSSTVLALIKGGKRDAIVTAIAPYLPPEIPR